MIDNFFWLIAFSIQPHHLDHPLPAYQMDRQFAVAGYVWSLAAGGLMHGLCAPTGAIGDLGIIHNSANFRPGHPVPSVDSRALTRAGVESVAPEGSGTLVARVARGYAKAGVKFSREPVAKVIRKELQELRRMPYLSDLGRETAEKAERFFAFINSRFSA